MNDSTTLPPAPAAADVLDARAQVQAIISEWQASGHPDTLAALGRFPQLRFDKSRLLDLAYEEYVERLAAGESIDPEAYCARFPEYQASVRRILESHEQLKQHEDLFADEPDFRWPEAGDCVAEFRVLRPLGRGGFARVYLAREEVTQRLVVLKVSPPDFAEPRALGRLAHDNVIPILGARVVDDAMLVVAMPYLGGSTLTDWLDIAFAGGVGAPPPDDVLARTVERNRLATETAVAENSPGPTSRQPYQRHVLDLARGIAEGLAYLHAAGIHHRDLKPSNVLLTWQGRAVILDFNLAVDVRRGLSECGGTLPYMAPEQIRAAIGDDFSPPVDHRADIFSFGVIVYQLLTGRHPFGLPERRSVSGLQMMSSERARAFLDKLESKHTLTLPGVESRLADLVRRCLRMDPGQRPQSAQAVAQELKRLARHDPARRRRRQRVLAAAVGILALAAGGASYHFAARPPVAERMLAGAMADLRGDRPLDAVHKLNRALEPGTINPNGYFLRGLSQLRADQVGAALADFEQARQQGIDDHGENSAALAYCYALSKNHPPAEHYGEVAEEQGFRSPAQLTNRAYSRLQQCDGKQSEWDVKLQQKALDDLNEALRLDARFGAALRLRAQVWMRQYTASKDRAYLERAIQDIEQAEINGARCAEYFMFGAGAVLQLKSLRPSDYELAIRWLNQAVDCGQIPSAIPLDGPFRSIATRPDFLAIRGRMPVPAAKTAHPILVDPLAEFVP